MSMILGSDFIDNSNSFNTALKHDGPNVYVQAYATSGAVANTAMLVNFLTRHTGSGTVNLGGYQATILATGLFGYVGVVRDQVALSSGSVGWFKIRGNVPSIQSANATGYTGSVGHAVIAYATSTAVGLVATSSGNTNNGDIGQCGVLTAEGDGSLDGQVYLSGVFCSVLDGG